MDLNTIRRVANRYRMHVHELPTKMNQSRKEKDVRQNALISFKGMPKSLIK